MPRLPRNDLTAERLRQIIFYDPITGFMGWRVGCGSKKSGESVGRQVELGYWRTQIDRHSYFLHRLAWLYVYGEWPRGHVHHINRDPSDNRIVNLEDISIQQNLALRRWGSPVERKAPPSAPQESAWWQESTTAQRRLLPKEALTADDLRYRLSYSPTTGVFTWKHDALPRKAGDVAGYLQRAGYRLIALWKRRYYEHRLAWLYMTGEWPKSEVDHINGQGDDNRWSNLRLASSSQNKCNRRVKSSSASGLKGISSHHTGKWVATAGKRRVVFSVFSIDTPQEANIIYAALAAELHGEFARSA